MCHGTAYMPQPNNTTYLQVILPPIPLQRCSEIRPVRGNPIEPPEALLIRRERDLVLSRLLDADAVVREGLRGVEVEDEE